MNASTEVTRAPRADRRGPSTFGWLLIQTGAVVLAGGIWWLASGFFPAGAIPTPPEVLGRLGQLVLTGEFWSAIGITVGTFALALTVSIVVAVPLGLVIGASTFWTQSTRLLFDFLRTIPPIALLPLLLLVLGADFEMVFGLAVLGAIWPILIQSIYAARQGEALLVDMSAAYRIPRGWFIRHIFVPGALPFVMTGVRLGTTICLLLTISGQLLGAAPGLGHEIAAAQAWYDTPRMYAYVLVAAILGLIVNAGVWAAQRRLLRWHPSVRGESR
ncbi:ABC-type nitrate/sulfonate/bicarbonate transport system permease component [Microbacterium ginsengiterrae]|uniref:ABC-type nitrate/sulfonate/bicarbonate transport system permease component n=1 Tax=Microbacterium ginsengiterrae TaxID=546115 RepID=A0A7W9CC70_9MICO|nr:ABC transporter permease subunit [Microbacterium ginsengiterrae]MBB5742909.1 ABC-type nitrate/sulfonate/bicarbonate transport system permease component [Microbacterium ginsengiterrae]